jgi:hypothetical protein
VNGFFSRGDPLCPFFFGVYAQDAVIHPVFLGNSRQSWTILERNQSTWESFSFQPPIARVLISKVQLSLLATVNVVLSSVKYLPAVTFLFGVSFGNCTALHIYNSKAVCIKFALVINQFAFFG